MALFISGCASNPPQDPPLHPTQGVLDLGRSAYLKGCVDGLNLSGKAAVFKGCMEMAKKYEKELSELLHSLPE